MSTSVFLYQAAIIVSIGWLTWSQGFVGYLLALVFWSAFTFFRAMTMKLKVIQGTVILASAAIFAQSAYTDLLLTVEKHGIFIVIGLSFVATIMLTLGFNWLSGVVYANMAKRIDDVHNFAESPRLNYESLKEVVKSSTLSACGMSDVLDTREPVYLSVPINEKEEVKELGGKWDPEASSSAFKAYLITVPLRHSRFASAWCVGDKAEIERLLKKHVTHLGKLSRLDLGRIRSFTVNEDAEAADLWSWRTLTKPRPGYAQAFETVKAPYWKRENRRQAWVPIAFRKNTGPTRP